MRSFSVFPSLSHPDVSPFALATSGDDEEVAIVLSNGKVCGGGGGGGGRGHGLPALPSTIRTAEGKVGQ